MNLSPELAVLLKMREKGQLAWDYLSDRPRVAAPCAYFHRVLIRKGEFQKLLLDLKKAGLVERVIQRGTPGASYRLQKSLTVYKLTPKGRELLKELGFKT